MRTLQAIVGMLCICVLANSPGLASGYGGSRKDDQPTITAASSTGRLSASNADLMAPAASTVTEERHAKNRRVELVAQ